MAEKKTWVSKNKVFLIIIGILYLFMLATSLFVINPGYKAGIILTYTFFFIFVLALYSLIMYCYNKAKTYSLKGAVIGLFIAILAFIGSINWYKLCYAKGCDFMRNLSIIGLLSFPFMPIYALFGLSPHNNFLKYISALIFILLGLLLGYLRSKSKKVFWIVFILLLIAYGILGLIALGMMFASFG